MQLSIQEVSRFVIGAAIIREMAANGAQKSEVTFSNVADMALRESDDGRNLRASIETVANNEASWFRSTPPHVLATERVMQTRLQEVKTLNYSNLAVLATLELGAEAGKQDAKEVLQIHLQAAVRAIDEMPGSTAERRSLLRSMKADTCLANGDPSFMSEQLKIAQKEYLENFRQERLAPYALPVLQRSEDLDFDM